MLAKHPWFATFRPGEDLERFGNYTCPQVVQSRTAPSMEELNKLIVDKAATKMLIVEKVVKEMFIVEKVVKETLKDIELKSSQLAMLEATVLRKKEIVAFATEESEDDMSIATLKK
eukprot:5028119-Heterocapsa_arctica.AAC.1